MAEPLEALLTKYRRPRPRSQVQPLDATGGDTPGMRGSINPLDSQAMADRAQGIDISSITPPTRLRADRIDDEAFAGETPVNLASDEGGQASPFMFASGSNARSQPVEQTQMVCGPNGCRVAQPMGGMPVQMQQLSSQSLPAGVSLAPGEQYVPGSLREGPPVRAAAPSAAAQQMAPAMTGTAAAPPGAAGSEPLPGYLDPERFLSLTQQYYGDSKADLQARSAIGAVQNQNRGVGFSKLAETAMVLAEKRRLNDQKMQIFNMAREDKKAADHRRSPKGQAELEAEVISMRATPEFRADQLLQLRNAARKQAGIVQTEAQAVQERQLLEGAITASDAISNQVRYESMLDAQKKKQSAGQPISDVERSRLKAAHAHLYDGLVKRYKKIPDVAARRAAMSEELYPAYVQEYEAYYKRNPSLVGEKPTDDDIANAAHSMALSRLGKNIARVNQFISAGTSPWAGLTYDELAAAASSESGNKTPAPSAAPQQPDDGAVAPPEPTTWKPPLSTPQVR